MHLHPPHRARRTARGAHGQVRCPRHNVRHNPRCHQPLYLRSATTIPIAFASPPVSSPSTPVPSFAPPTSRPASPNLPPPALRASPSASQPLAVTAPHLSAPLRST